MAKFNDYLIHAETVEGTQIYVGEVTALGLEQAWHKAVASKSAPSKWHADLQVAHGLLNEVGIKYRELAIGEEVKAAA